MSKKHRKQNELPPSVNVTLDGVTLNILREEAVNPADWITLKEYKKMLDQIQADNGIENQERENGCDWEID